MRSYWPFCKFRANWELLVSVCMRMISFSLAGARRFCCQLGSGKWEQVGCKGTGSLYPAHLAEVESMLIQELRPSVLCRRWLSLTSSLTLSKLQQKAQEKGKQKRLEWVIGCQQGPKLKGSRGASTPARAESSTEPNICKSS